MRVVAGKYKGKNLFSPINNDVRPTTTRIKETIFNIIQFKVKNSICLDLFAGSGSLGIECISRGSNEVIFVDNNKNSITLINQNLKGIAGNYKVFNCDFYSSLRSCYAQKLKFDLIFLDPPYLTNLGEDAINYIIDMKLLNDNGIIIFEHGKEKKFILNNNKYNVRTKVMGNVVAEFISKKHICMFAGSFDPFTIGHRAVIDYIYNDYDEIIVSLLVNNEKQYFYSIEDRLNITTLALENYKKVKIISSDKLAVEVAKENNVDILIRSYRNDKDLIYEEKMAEFNKINGFETRLINLDEYKDVSSTNCRDKILNNDYSLLCLETINYIKNINCKI